MHETPSYFNFEKFEERNQKQEFFSKIVLWEKRNEIINMRLFNFIQNFKVVWLVLSYFTKRFGPKNTQPKINYAGLLGAQIFFN